MFFNYMAKLQEYFGKKLDDSVIDVYWQGLGELPEEKFRMAVKNIFTDFVPTSTTPFPLVSHFLKYCGEGTETKAINVISVLKNAVFKYGPYQSVTFGDRALHSVIERYGGWQTICNWTNEDWGFNEKRFIEAYKAAQISEYGKDYLAGIHEIENAGKGFDEKQIFKVKWDGFKEYKTKHIQDGTNTLIENLSNKMEMP